VFSDSGITLAVIRSPYRNTFYRGLNILSICIGVILCLMLLLLLYPISLFYHNTALIKPGIFISLLFICRSFYIVPMAILQKNLHFVVYGKIILIATATSAISIIMMAYCGLSYWALIWSQFINAACMIFFVYRINSERVTLVRKAVFAKTFLISKSLIGSLIGFNSINYWARNADNLLAGKYYGMYDLGIYNRAYQMLQLPLNLITGLFNTVLFPSMVKYKNEGGNIEREYYFILKIISLINLPIALVLIIFPKQFVHILWGDNWLHVADLLPYFGLLVMTQTLNSTLGNLLILENKEKTLMISGWIGSALLITGIVFGTTISLTAIAAFYALSFIVLVLPFQIIYIYKIKLGYSGIFKYWIPKIVICLLIWIGIYKQHQYLVNYALTGWLVIILFDMKHMISKAPLILSKLKSIK
jgi:teichuronic acid exporter